MASQAYVDMIRQHFETDLPDAAIARAVDNAEQEVARVLGPECETVDTIVRDRGWQRTPRIYTSWPIDEIVQIDEASSFNAITLDPDDYRIVGPNTIERLTSGPNYGRTWGHHIDVRYTVEPDPRRELAIVDLVKYELQFNGAQQQNAGGYQVSMGDWIAQKRRILASLQRGFPLR